MRILFRELIKAFSLIQPRDDLAGLCNRRIAGVFHFRSGHLHPFVIHYLVVGRLQEYLLYADCLLFKLYAVFYVFCIQNIHQLRFIRHIGKRLKLVGCVESGLPRLIGCKSVYRHRFEFADLVFPGFQHGIFHEMFEVNPFVEFTPRNFSVCVSGKNIAVFFTSRRYQYHADCKYAHGLSHVFLL